MRIHLRAVLDVAAVLGGKEHTPDIREGTSVGELLSALFALHGERLAALLLEKDEPMTLLPHMRIYINGRGLDFLDGFATVLHEDDDVMIMPQLSGG